MSAEFYGILGIPAKSPVSIVQKAYKQAALRLHPDKNRSNPNATERFHAIAEAYAVLSDPAAKAAYDEKIALEEARLARLAQMDERRRGLRESLLAREKQAASFAANFREKPGEAERMAAAKFQMELERVRRKQYRTQSAFKPDTSTDDHEAEDVCTVHILPQRKPNRIIMPFVDECKGLSLDEYEAVTFQRFRAP
ncbi:DnaJ (Hsp40) [Mitosporidium daphniae]|uniref:J domain-containing protein n=1 Tax=Mitosporidium daphniae TaxID=1485682 RepID=A0A098VR22_9MICR|nr:uncharacterized protein DI09_81p40 [Mitosporidium daphniae]KGG50201.1 hypothetical protein DI09_81p40 [Mitosporidium daphniae]|eukprot:XP_013236637.1 uncharacterized protein DI09_81p40 [Mitosporidium daphniae]